MSLSLFNLLFVVVFCTYFIIYRRTQLIRDVKRRLDGLNDIACLRQLIECLPQHRGMANAFLLGDDNFQSKIANLDVKIDKELSVLIKLVNTKDKWSIADKVNYFNDQWKILKRDLNGLEPTESFKRHTALVASLLFLIDDIGDAANLLTTQDVVYAKLADATLRKLPLMTEMLGQARGMGTGVITKGVCDTNMRVKLTYLLNTANRVANEVCIDVKASLESENKLKQQASKVLIENQKATEYFLNILNKDIINEKNISVTSTDYYDAGSNAIQYAFSLLDAILVSMKNNLQSFVDRLSKNIFIAKIIAVSISLTAIYLYQM